MPDDIVPWIFWFPLQPWSPWPRVLCLGSGLTWDVPRSAHDAITSPLLSVTLVTWHSSRVTGPQCGVGRESDVTQWAGRGLWQLWWQSMNTPVMVSLEFCSILEERCFHFRKTGYRYLWLFNGFPRELKWSFFPNDDFLPQKEFHLLLQKI